MFRRILDYFYAEVSDNEHSEPEDDLDKVYNILNEGRDTENIDEHSVAEEVATEFDTFVKKGMITGKDGSEYIINETYPFIPNSSHNFCIGSHVSFTLILSSGQIKVLDVALIENDWNVVDDKKSTWCSRVIVCKVIKRNGRQLVLYPDEFEIDLNKINSEFIPIVGDWIEMDAKCEVDEYVTNLNGKILEVNKIRPMRPQIKAGAVSFWDSTARTGSIDKVIFFSIDSLSKGYIPLVGDKVICEIIESDQQRFTWRALKVFPDYLVKKIEDVVVEVEADFEENHTSVQITNDITLNYTNLNEVLPFSIEVKNVSLEDINLLEISIPKENRQCQVITEIHNIKIVPNETFKILFECTSKSIGQTTELIILKFSGFKVGRWVTVNINQNKNYKYNTGRYRNSYNYTPKTPKDCIRGQQISASVRFINVKIPQFQIPEKFLKHISQYSTQQDNARLLEELRVLKPSLFKDLCYNNYEDRFHTLLYLDEISALVSISIYDQPNACFIKNGEYLMLEIENLMEKKPSIIVGDKILATDIHSVDGTTYEGVVHKVIAKHVYLKFRQDFHTSYDGEDYSVTVVSGRSTYRRMHYAIGMALKNLGRELLFPSQVVEKTPQVKFIIDDTPDQDKLPRRKMLPPEETLRLFVEYKQKVQSQLLLSNDVDKNDAELKIERAASDLKLEWYNSSLNFYQKEAVKNILLGISRPLPYIIFGPPGTGKTVTLVETILQILRYIPHTRLLVTAPSNSASDLLALRLIDSGVLKPGDLVRIVSLTHINSNLIPPRLVPYCTFPNIAAEDTHIKEITVTNSGLAIDCTSAVLGRHRITVTTCSSAGLLHQMGFPRGHFSHILVDEASQACEPGVMIPLSFFDRDTGQIILAGDPMQLGPTVLSKAAEELGLGESYQERLINRFPYLRDPEGFPKTGGYDPRLVTKLLYNYRSLPTLLNLSSSMFYNSELLPTILDTDSNEMELLNKLKDILPKSKKGKVPAIVFHGVNGENFQTTDSPSWFNPDEASQVFYYVNEFYRLGLTNKDIGIISPYIKQVKEIRSILNEAEFDVPKVGSVEEFQGQEFNVILLSTVRSNEDYLLKDVTYSLGFVSNPRRLNVAITRAKSLLIIIGNANLLSNDVHWRTVIKYCVEHGGYTGCAITV